MKPSLAVALLVHSIGVADAHYSFTQLVIDDVVSKEWQYIRKHAAEYIAYPYYYRDANDVNIRCNPLASTSWPDTETATVQAGSKIGFSVGPEASRSDTRGRIFHEGPAQAFLSKTNDLANYQGDGDWFKIQEIGAKNKTAWELDGQEYVMNFTVPEKTPPGTYLFRAQHLFGINPDGHYTQVYTSCAHVKVEGPGGGSPSPMFKIPKDYRPYSQGFTFPQEATTFLTEAKRNYLAYKHPGPALWNGN